MTTFPKKVVSHLPPRRNYTRLFSVYSSFVDESAGEESFYQLTWFCRSSSDVMQFCVSFPVRNEKC